MKNKILLFMFLFYSSPSFSDPSVDPSQDDLDEMCPSGTENVHLSFSHITKNQCESKSRNDSNAVWKYSSWTYGVPNHPLYSSTSETCYMYYLQTDDCDSSGGDGAGGDGSGGDGDGGDGSGGDGSGGDGSGGDGDGGDGSGGDGSGYEGDCVTGVDDNPNTLSINECTGETNDTGLDDTDRDKNENQCGIGLINTGTLSSPNCLPIPKNCGYVNNSYGCWDDSDTNCGTYTNSDGLLVDGCFNPVDNISDPDTTVTDPTDPPVTDPPVTDPPVTDPPVTDMTKTNQKLDNLLQQMKNTDSNQLNEQKKGNGLLDSINDKLSSIKTSNNKILSESIKINENLESMTEETSENLDSQIKSDVDQKASNDISMAFSDAQSSFLTPTTVADGSVFSSGLKTFIPSYSQCHDFTIDTPIYSLRISCERFEQWKEIFKWCLYAFTFYNIFGLAIRPVGDK